MNSFSDAGSIPAASIYRKCVIVKIAIIPVYHDGIQGFIYITINKERT